MEVVEVVDGSVSGAGQVAESIDFVSRAFVLGGVCARRSGAVGF